MRKLKFRVWNGTKFVTKADTYIKTSNGSLWDYEEDYGGTFSSNKKLWSADGKIQQYTGLLDSNRNEIYEGDIVKFNEPTKLAEGVYMASLYVFDFYEGSFTRPYIYNSINGSKFVRMEAGALNPVGRAKLDDNQHFDWTKAEVLGNILSNPELIDR